MNQEALWRTMHSFDYLMEERGVGIKLFGPNPYKYGDEGVLEVDGLGGLGQAITAVGGFARNTGKSDGDVAIDALRDEASRARKMLVPKASASGGRSDKEG